MFYKYFIIYIIFDVVVVVRVCDVEYFVGDRFSVIVFCV